MMPYPSSQSELGAVKRALLIFTSCCGHIRFKDKLGVGFGDGLEGRMAAQPVIVRSGRFKRSPLKTQACAWIASTSGIAPNPWIVSASSRVYAILFASITGLRRAPRDVTDLSRKKQVNPTRNPLLHWRPSSHNQLHRAKSKNPHLQGKICHFMQPVICFRETPLEKIARKRWTYPGFVGVEFFPDQFVSVRVTSICEPGFDALLRWVDDGEKMMLDLEWKPGNDTLPCLFQIGSSNGVLIIKHPPELPADPHLREFLLNHEFYMKGMFMDREKLQMRFGDDFELTQFDDIEESMLKPHGLPINFNKMIRTLARESPCAQFKDKSISVSDWTGQLETGQVLYAAFDVVGLAAAIEGAETVLALMQDDV